MANFRVQWTASARQDLTEIIQFIAADNPDTALHQLVKIEQRAQTLTQHPQRGRIVPELLTIGIANYRELIIKPWRLIYRIQDKQVYVISLIDGRRNLEDILLDRLINAE